MKIFWVDLETTGLDTNKCSIHQLAALVEVDGVIVEKIDLRMRPIEGGELSNKALSMSGMTLEEMQRLPDPFYQFKQLFSILSKYVSDKPFERFYMNGKNVLMYDLPILKRYMKLYGFEFTDYFYRRVADVQVDSLGWMLRNDPSYLDKNSKGGLTLGNLCKYFKIPLDGSRFHEALYDIEMTRELFKNLK